MKPSGAALILLAALTQAACVPTPEQAARAVPREVRVTDDPFRPLVSFSVRPPITFAAPQGRSTDVDVVLTGGITRATGVSTFLAAITVEYIGAWAFYEDIRGEGGRRLNFVGARRNVRCLTGGCIFTEEFAAGLEPSDVRRSAESGTPIVFKVFGRNGGEFPVIIPAAYSQMLLERMGSPSATARVQAPAGTTPPPTASIDALPVVAAPAPSARAGATVTSIAAPATSLAARNPFDLVAVANQARDACTRARRNNCDTEVEAALRRAEDERQRQAAGRAQGR